MSARATPRRTPPDAPTLDAASNLEAHGRTDAEFACGRVQLVSGSESLASSATQSLLRARLRAAALVMCAGSAAWLVKNLVHSGLEGVADRLILEHGRILTFFHAVHVLVMAATAAWLCRRCRITLRKLRLAELVAFGWTTAFLVGVQHFQTLYMARLHGVLANPAPTWLALAFTYALFIPNSSRRAAVVLAGMCAAPLATLAFDTWLPAMALDSGRVPYFRDAFAALALIMALCYGTCVYGTHMIYNLRQEALAARQLGQYRLRRLLGEGGMGEVYLAEHQMLKRPCAIKVIRPSKARDPRALARFEREVQATARLTHWNTVEIFDYGRTDDGTFFYVMEYLPGMSLAGMVEQYGPLPAGRVIHLLMQTCDALAEAHAIGLVHRDIKPGNIFAAQRGGVYDVAKLLDFGLVKPLDGPASIEITQDGTLTGSPLFMSPEQAMGENDPDARGDIYSLGAVAYYLLTGRPVFDADKPLKALLAHAHEPPQPPSVHARHVPADLEAVIMRCLQKRPEDRFQDVVSLRAALSACQDAGTWTHEDAARWWQSRGLARSMPWQADAPETAVQTASAR
jgi:serine/threonine-protein kinase